MNYITKIFKSGSKVYCFVFLKEHEGSFLRAVESDAKKFGEENRLPLEGGLIGEYDFVSSALNLLAHGVIVFDGRDNLLWKWTSDKPVSIESLVRHLKEEIKNKGYLNE